MMIISGMLPRTTSWLQVSRVEVKVIIDLCFRKLWAKIATNSCLEVSSIGGVVCNDNFLKGKGVLQ